MSSALTPARSRLLLSLLLALGFLSQIFYLTRPTCPIDLSGDEAQYWDWSRKLELSYYSKGPLVAYIIRASCWMFGQDSTPAVRFPALVLGVMTSLVTYWLTAKLFKSEKLALGTVALTHVVPMFVAGSMLMTIDPPFYFCWALATTLAAIALFDDRRWLWPIIGLIIGVGALAKYAALLWLPIAGVALYVDGPRGRAILKSAWPWIAAVIALACMTPVVIWNARHNWVTLHHVATQTGAAGASKWRGAPIEFVVSQFGAIGPTVGAMMVGAVIYALRNNGPFRRELLYLVTIGLSFWIVTLLDSFITKVQVNWPAPAYFTLMIVTAHFIATRMESPTRWKNWRGWFYTTIVIGLIFLPISRDSATIMPVMKRVATLSSKIDPGNLDFMERLRGWKMLGTHIASERARIEPAFILCDDYQQTAEAAFYTPGQPITYCAGPYFGKRLSQYDMWPERRLHDNPQLIGQNAVYVGKGKTLPDEVRAAFDRVERLPEIPVYAGDVQVKSFKLWLCYGFKGMQPAKSHDF